MSLMAETKTKPTGASVEPSIVGNGTYTYAC